MQPVPAYITSDGYKLMYQPKIDMAKARIREVRVELTDDNIVKFYAELGGWLIGPNGENVDTLARPLVLKKEKKTVEIKTNDVIIEGTNEDEETNEEKQSYDTKNKPKRGRPAKNNW